MLILGFGFTGRAVARLAGVPFVTTARDGEKAAALRREGIRVADLAELPPSPRVLVTFPPDGVTDRALAPRLRGRTVVYLSSTGVYGDVSGTVDETTPARGSSPRARARLQAEAIWRDVGATVVRSPAIYGPGRGLHLRLVRGEVKLPEGAHRISRVHVHDLATALAALLARDVRDETFVMGDLEPAPHADVVAWLCARLSLPLPERVPLERVDETLRHDRCVDARRIRERLALRLRYPTYREGFAHCIEQDLRSA